MRFRLGVAVGFAAGYVLGTKAGRERYEQIRETTKGLWASEASKGVRDAAEKVAHQASEVIGAAKGKLEAEEPAVYSADGGNGKL